MGALDLIPDLYNIRIDNPLSDKQSDEFFIATIDGEERRFNIHDYNALYAVPWLYDIALYRILGCATPTEMAGALNKTWSEAGVDPRTLDLLELGAGSGPFGHVLKEDVGVGRLAGLDISPVAKEAALRDRPEVYEEYFVVDLTLPLDELSQTAPADRFDCVAVASATGWGNHIPVAGFENAFQLLKPGGWWVFHVKPSDPDPECIELCHWIEEKVASGALDQKYRQSHFHRNNSKHMPIYYDVVIGVKR